MRVGPPGADDPVLDGGDPARRPVAVGRDRESDLAGRPKQRPVLHVVVGQQQQAPLDAVVTRNLDGRTVVRRPTRALPLRSGPTGKKNKVAPQLRAAEYDVNSGQGIEGSGSLLDVVEQLCVGRRAGAATSRRRPESASALEDNVTQLLGSEGARARAAVNTELISLYWSIGKTILERQDVEGWGAKVIDRLSQDLRREFPEMKGLSRSNLHYMRKLAEAWPGEIVQQPVGQMPWGHITVLLDRVQDQGVRGWYAAEAVRHGWFRAVLTFNQPPVSFTNALVRGLFESQSCHFEASRGPEWMHIFTARPPRRARSFGFLLQLPRGHAVHARS